MSNRFYNEDEYLLNGKRAVLKLVAYGNRLSNVKRKHYYEYTELNKRRNQIYLAQTSIRRIVSAFFQKYPNRELGVIHATKIHELALFLKKNRKRPIQYSGV